jgi:hypothetical protein
VPGQPRLSSAGDDKALAVARQLVLRKSHARTLAGLLAEALEARLGHLWRKGSAAIGRECDEVCNAAQQHNHLQQRRAVLFHMAAMLDVNECSLDWLPESERAAYYVEMYRAIALDKAAIAHTADEAVVHDADELAGSRSSCKHVHTRLMADLQMHGRREAETALQWWRAASTDNSIIQHVVSLQTAARAVLSMQASSAPAERLFSNSGNLEGDNRHCAAPETMEMYLIIRRFVLSRLGGDPLGDDIMPMAPGTRQFYNLCHSVAAKVQSAAAAAEKD